MYRPWAFIRDMSPIMPSHSDLVKRAFLLPLGRVWWWCRRGGQMTFPVNDDPCPLPPELARDIEEGVHHLLMGEEAGGWKDG